MQTPLKRKHVKRSDVAIAPSPDAAENGDASAGRIFGLITSTGYIDIFGYSLAAGGWFFSGWIPRPLRIEQTDSVECLTQFETSQFKGMATPAFYQREDLDHTRIGFVAFVSGSSTAVGSLRCLSIVLDGVTYLVHAGSSTVRLSDQEIVDRIRGTLIHQAFANRNLEHLLAITSRPRFMGHDTLDSLSQTVLMEIDEAVLCPPGDLLLRGWQLSVPGAVRSIRVRSGALAQHVNLSDAIGSARPDVIAAVGHQQGFTDAHCGFTVFVPAAISSGDVSYLEVELENGEIGFKSLRLSRRSGMDAVKYLLEGIDVRYGEIDRAFDKVLGPAISALNAARLQEPPSPYEIDFGPVPPKPRYSLIIPLFGRIDFVEYQMALFSRHSDIKQAEIIYVLDDPSKRRELESLAASVYERFGISFRLLLLPRNLGFAPANNIGLRSARGEFICFMNSDVFPITANWMEGLIDLLKRNPKIGIIGPRLLFEDGSIQHEGCFYRPIEEFGHWMFIDHHNKGRRPGKSRGLRTHDVITAACMVMRRSEALELGGFDEEFIIGDFEDSDLCFRARERGLSCAIDDAVQLYHLERKSQASPNQSWRMNLTLYNAWVHQRRWFSAGRALGALDDPRP